MHSNKETLLSHIHLFPQGPKPVPQVITSFQKQYFHFLTNWIYSMNFLIDLTYNWFSTTRGLYSWFHQKSSSSLTVSITLLWISATNIKLSQLDYQRLSAGDLIESHLITSEKGNHNFPNTQDKCHKFVVCKYSDLVTRPPSSDSEISDDIFTV